LIAIININRTNVFGRKTMKKPWRILSVASLAAALLAIGSAEAAENVKIGVIYPLTGNAASAGQSAKDAVNLGVEIVNTAHPELKALPLGATAGLPNLGGAKVELDEADHQGNPQVGQQQTLRLITQDHVVAMLGSYHSSVSLVATAVAERQGIRSRSRRHQRALDAGLPGAGGRDQPRRIDRTGQDPSGTKSDRS
jgi:hypothetical protein